MKKNILNITLLLAALSIMLPVFADAYSSKDVLARINAQRASAGIATVKEDPALTAIANRRAMDLHDASRFTHQGWKAYLQGMNYSYRGENLARGFADADSMTAALMNSPTHKRTMLNASYTHVGVGTYKDYVVQIYGGNADNFK